MKKIVALVCSLLVVSCTVDAQLSVSPRRLAMIGDSLPLIRHVTDMKVSGDTLYYVYETEEGFDQRFIRKAIIDKDKARLRVGKEMGKRDGGYYVSYMPYLFFDTDDKAHVVNQDDCEVLDLAGNDSLTKTKEYLITGKSLVPFSLSRYVQDVFVVSPHHYVFIGRKPNGGAQYVLSSNTVTERIDTIRKVAITPQLQAWMPNAGELAYSRRCNRMAFAYRLHPIIGVFDMDGNTIKRLRLAKNDTFDARTLEEADFEGLNPLRIVDVTSSKDNLFALYWGHKYGDLKRNVATSVIYQIDWNGEVISQYTVNASLRKIAYCDESLLVGWDGNDFVLIPLR